MDGLPPVEQHNALINQIIRSAKEEKKTFLIKETGDNYILIEDDCFYGMGKIGDEQFVAEAQQLKPLLAHYPENEVIRSMIKTYITRYPMRVIMLD